MFYSLPVGAKLLSKLCPPCVLISKENRYKIAVLFWTFIAYGSYHLSRRPFSVVKSELYRNCSDVTPTLLDKSNSSTWCDWDPFDSNDILGFMDSIYLFSYAIFMFFSGFLAERFHLRYFLAIGMIGSGIFTYLFGIARYYNIHNLYYFIIIQFICGAFQTTGWPAVVAAVGHWFGPHSSRGLIFGLWNSHTSFGNMFGAYISGMYVNTNWGLSFIVPGAIVAGAGFLIFLFLVPYPEEVNLDDKLETLNDASLSEENVNSQASEFSSSSRRRLRHVDYLNGKDEEAGCLLNESSDEVSVEMPRTAISFFSAFMVPGVIEFSFSLFFSKMVSYTFLYWLPMYLKDSLKLSAEDSANLSTTFDVGGIAGAIVAGIIADKSGASGLTCIFMLLLTLPSMYLYVVKGAASFTVNVIYLLVLGALVNGPYALITTAVAADLSNQVTDSKSMATVTAIIDGTGSIGAAVGPLLAGVISNNRTKWNRVFYMVMIADILSLILLLRVAKHEITKKLRRKFKSRVIET